jgi:hypothetical protein
VIISATNLETSKEKKLLRVYVSCGKLVLQVSDVEGSVLWRSALFPS